MKAARNDYTEAPFFFQEIFEGEPRTIIWHNSSEGQRNIFYTLLEMMGDKIEYLLKEDTQNENVMRKWRKFFGGVYKSDFAELLKNFDSWFFEDSVFQICLREPDGKGYFVYDEHGLFFIYDNIQVSKELERLGLKNEIRPLVTEKPHWCKRPKNSEKIYSAFVSALEG